MQISVNLATQENQNPPRAHFPAKYLAAHAHNSGAAPEQHMSTQTAIDWSSATPCEVIGMEVISTALRLKKPIPRNDWNSQRSV